MLQEVMHRKTAPYVIAAMMVVAYQSLNASSVVGNFDCGPSTLGVKMPRT